MNRSQRTEFINSITTEQSVAIPVHLKYAFRPGKKFRIYLFAGPGVSYGIDMKAKYTFEKDPEIVSPFVPNYEGYITRNMYTGKVSSDIDDDKLIASYTDGGNTFSRFDVMAGIGAGVQWWRVFLEAGYDMGFLDRSKDSGETRRHDQWSVIAGLTF